MAFWKKLSERKFKINRYRAFIVRKYQLPSGQTGTYYIYNRHQVVCALVQRRDKRFVLAKQYRPGPEKIMHELPGGEISSGETPRQAISREVLEETGYRGKIKMIGSSSHDAWANEWRYHFLITEAVPLRAPSPDKFESIHPEVVTFEELKTFLKKGQLTDAETALRGLLQLGYYRENKKQTKNHTI